VLEGQGPNNQHEVGGERGAGRNQQRLRRLRKGRSRMGKDLGERVAGEQ
jgi:hypothetical protein